MRIKWVCLLSAYRSAWYTVKIYKWYLRWWWQSIGCLLLSIHSSFLLTEPCFVKIKHGNPASLCLRLVWHVSQSGQWNIRGFLLKVYYSNSRHWDLLKLDESLQGLNLCFFFPGLPLLLDITLPNLKPDCDGRLSWTVLDSKLCSYSSIRL